MSAVVRIDIEQDVAVIVIDNPPINAGSTEVRAGLLEAVEQVCGNSAVNSAVVIGAGTTFIAGSDIREFGAPLAEPQLPAVIAAIEACPKPFVAALHGAALGGGLELALGCDARIALTGSVVGLPETTLGIIPGAGGTQRLPRLVGVPKAISMICAGERAKAEAALAIGLVDKVVASDLRAEAVAFARNLVGSKRIVRDLAVPACDVDEIAKASQAALKAGKNRPHIKAAIASINNTTTMSAGEGLAWERATFQQLRASREARALRHQFFAERDAAKNPDVKGVDPRPVGKVAVIGAGNMGSGIALAALDSGLTVILIEQEQTFLDRGVARIQSYYEQRAKAGKVSAEQAAARLARLLPALDWNTIAQADLVIEAVFENLAVKQEVFRKLDAVARPGAVLASNTSYLDVDAIAQATSRPQDVAGLHFFSPANVMRLLEIVRGKQTAPDTLATCLQLARQLRKVSVVSSNAFGFIGNRIYAAYRRQCEFIMEEGATPQQIDAALEGFGFAMGPFAVTDMSGLDIAWHMRKAQAATRDPLARYVKIPDMLCEAGRLGQKTGAGYYKYDAPGAKRQIDPALDDFLAQARAEKGIVARHFSAEQIVKRAMLAIVNESAQIIAEKVAVRSSDIDVALVNGYGFPKWEGGPVFWAQDFTAETLQKEIEWLAEQSGPGFVSGDVRHVLQQTK